MKLSYEVFVRYEIYHTLEAIPDSDRERFLRFFELLENDPFQEGDYSESDRSGRQYQIKIIGKRALYYWSDHAEKEVRVVDLVDADMT